MDDAAVVRGRQAAGDLHRVLDGLPDGQRAGAKAVAERLAFEQLRDNERRAVLGADVMDREDVRVVERRGGLGFLRESPEPIRIRGEVVRKHLDRHFTPERRVARAIDLAHPARTERREDLAASESRPW